jgi:hypothetical protein
MLLFLYLHFYCNYACTLCLCFYSFTQTMGSPATHDKIRGFSSRTGTPFLYVILFRARRRVIVGIFKGTLTLSPTLYGQYFALCHSTFGTFRPLRAQIEQICRDSFLSGFDADALAYDRVCVLPVVFEAFCEDSFRFLLFLPCVSFVRFGGGRSLYTLALPSLDPAGACDVSSTFSASRGFNPFDIANRPVSCMKYE